jgi:hypothetical protein
MVQMTAKQVSDSDRQGITLVVDTFVVAHGILSGMNDSCMSLVAVKQCRGLFEGEATRLDNVQVDVHKLESEPNYVHNL